MEEEIRVRIPREGQILGVVESLLGTNKLRVRCQDEKVRLCRIPGKMRKRLWLNQGTVVLVEPRPIKGDMRADVVWKYRTAEVAVLRKKHIFTMHM